jgi:hypothetical protein
MSTNSELLALYVDAEKKILLGQDVSFGDRRLGMPDLQFVQAERRRLQSLVAAEGGQGGGFRIADFRSAGTDVEA